MLPRDIADPRVFAFVDAAARLRAQSLGIVFSLPSNEIAHIARETVISIKASCIDSTASAEAVFAAEVQKLKEEKFKPLEQLTLEPYERDHAVVTGEYRP